MFYGSVEANQRIATIRDAQINHPTTLMLWFLHLGRSICSIY